MISCQSIRALRVGAVVGVAILSLVRVAVSQDDPTPVDVGQLIKELRSDDAAERAAAARKLGDAGDLKAVEPLIAALKDWEESVRRVGVAEGRARHGAVGGRVEGRQ
jgi:HEAT repeat protein